MAAILALRSSRDLSVGRAAEHGLEDGELIAGGDGSGGGVAGGGGEGGVGEEAGAEGGAEAGGEGEAGDGESDLTCSHRDSFVPAAWRAGREGV
jgi:hypothetical protein